LNLSLTPDMIAAAYELLRTTPPFRRWGLPEADDVGFYVIAAKGDHGSHWTADFAHHIAINKCHTQLPSLLNCVAHEMCHMRQFILGEKSYHGPVFKRLADQVCRHHGFDRGMF